MATRSNVVGPREEYVAIVSSSIGPVPLWFVAPTVITFRELQGLVMVTCPLRPRLPAEHTTTTPASQSASTASTSGSTEADSTIGCPRERLTTRIPYSVLCSPTH